MTTIQQVAPLASTTASLPSTQNAHAMLADIATILMLTKRVSKEIYADVPIRKTRSLTSVANESVALG